MWRAKALKASLRFGATVRTPYPLAMGALEWRASRSPVTASAYANGCRPPPPFPSSDDRALDTARSGTRFKLGTRPQTSSRMTGLPLCDSRSPSPELSPSFVPSFLLNERGRGRGGGRGKSRFFRSAVAGDKRALDDGGRMRRRRWMEGWWPRPRPPPARKAAAAAAAPERRAQSAAEERSPEPAGVLGGGERVRIPDEARRGGRGGKSSDARQWHEAVSLSVDLSKRVRQRRSGCRREKKRFRCIFGESRGPEALRRMQPFEKPSLARLAECGHVRGLPGARRLRSLRALPDDGNFCSRKQLALQSERVSSKTRS
ncbi:hypothetical protein MPTK2_3g24840 [Marchantia polymorpha subsp. ruderalis]